MDKYSIAPSILSADFARLGEEVTAILEAGADVIHFDVMDNHYVPNLTIGPMVCKALRNYGITAPLDVHLMTEPIDSLIEPFALSGATYISFHPEATKHVDRTIELIRHHGCKAGIALNPATSLTHLAYILDKIDLILVMTVNPGFGGQSFIPGMLSKIQATRELIDRHKSSVILSVDGGIHLDNVGQVAASGANMFVAGSAIFREENYAEIIQKFRNQIEASKKMMGF